MPNPVPLSPPAMPGFTMVELLMVVAIVGVLAAAAVPSYTDSVRRGRLVEAVMRLSDHHVRMEQYFLDNRRYDDGTGSCGYRAPPAGAADAFSVECAADETTYTVTVRGIAGKGAQAFAFSVDQSDTHKTISVPEGWASSDSCWVMRRDGACL